MTRIVRKEATSLLLLVLCGIAVLPSLVSGYYDLYSTLEVPRDADDRQIKKAFRHLSKKWHPDTPGGSREKFQEIQEAYNVLVDLEKRRYYDRNGEPPQEGSNRHPSGFSHFYNFNGRPPPRAEPIKSDAKSLTVDILKAIRASGRQQVTIVGLYQNHYYECLMYAKVWETLIKGKLRHLVQFYRVDTWNDQDITAQLQIGSHGVPGLIALVGTGSGMKQHTFSPSGDAVSHGGEIVGVREASTWIESFYVDTIKLGTTLLETHKKPGNIYKWAAGLSIREMGILVFPSMPDDPHFLHALVSRTRSREVSIVRVDSRDAVLQFLYAHCPSVARNELGNAIESREFVFVFNRSDLCEASIIKTGRNLKIDRVMPFVEHHRAVPPLTAGRCGQQKGQDELCFLWVLPSGYTTSSVMVEPQWAETLRSHLGPFVLYHVSEDDEPNFVRQLDLNEQGSGRRSRLNDLIFVAYLGMEPENYGVIRVPQDTNLDDRMEQKVPGTLQQFLHGQKLTRGRKGIDDIMSQLILPEYPLSLANNIWYSIPDVPLLKSIGSLALIYLLMQFFMPNNTQQAKQRPRQQQQQQQQQPGARSSQQQQSQRQQGGPQPRSTQQQQHAEYQRQQQAQYQQQQSQYRTAQHETRQAPQSNSRRRSPPPATRQRAPTPPGPPRTKPATNGSSPLLCRGIPFLGRQDLASDDFDGFVILMFIPDAFQADPSRHIEMPIPMEAVKAHPKIRLRAVGTTQDAVWTWMRRQAESRQIAIPNDRVTMVATRPKKGKAVIRPANALQSGAEWVTDLFQGGVSLDITFSLSGK